MSDEPIRGSQVTGRRSQLLQVLRDAPAPRSITELAEALQVHPNTIRFHLDALARSGQVEQLLADTAGPGRPPVLFRATHRMDPDGPTNYRLIAGMLVEHLAMSSPDPTSEAAAIGRAWAPHLLPANDTAGTTRATRPRQSRQEVVGQLVDVLTDLDFEPEQPTLPRTTRVRLRHCPFLDLTSRTPPAAKTATADARADSSGGQVVCALHLGLMQGILATLNGTVTVDRLDPYVEPDLCVAHLANAGTTSRRLSRPAADHG